MGTMWFCVKRDETNMHLDFCTLFFSNYLDKALVLYDSLAENCDSFTLYALAMDDRGFEVLKDLKLDSLVPISFDRFADSDIKSLVGNRGNAELCWTCTPKLIKYVMDKYCANICTYLDADLCFYSNPSILIEEMLAAGASVQLVRHNFPKYKRKKSERNAGAICIEFNPFYNDDKGRTLLDEWEKACVADCRYKDTDKLLGDQIYVQDWPKKYSCVNVSHNQGAGVAPWNNYKFRFKKGADGRWIVTDRETQTDYEIVFYHFQNIKFVDSAHVICCLIDKENKDEVKTLYLEYLKKILEKKKMLRDIYGINHIIKYHPAVTNTEKKRGLINFIKRNAFIEGKLSLYFAFSNVWNYCLERIVGHNMEELIVHINAEDF